MKTFGMKTIVVAGLFIFAFASCKKDQTCHGTIYVNDVNNNKVPGVIVQLDASNVGGQLVYREKTDAHGEAHFDIKLPAIYNITVSDASNPALTGTGILNVDEARKSNYSTVKLQ